MTSGRGLTTPPRENAQRPPVTHSDHVTCAIASFNMNCSAQIQPSHWIKRKWLSMSYKTFLHETIMWMSYWYVIQIVILYYILLYDNLNVLYLSLFPSQVHHYFQQPRSSVLTCNNLEIKTAWYYYQIYHQVKVSAAQTQTRNMLMGSTCSPKNMINQLTAHVVVGSGDTKGTWNSIKNEGITSSRMKLYKAGYVHLPRRQNDFARCWQWGSLTQSIADVQMSLISGALHFYFD